MSETIKSGFQPETGDDFHRRLVMAKNILSSVTGPIPGIDYGTDLTNVQGAIAEWLVQQIYGDHKQVQNVLKTWENAEIGQGKQRKAAHIPDWLVLNTTGEVTHIIEVKAVAGDRKQVEGQHNKLIQAWLQLNDARFQPSDVSRWRDRISQAWPSTQHKIQRQLTEHLVRAQELAFAGIIDLSQNCRLVIFSPEGEDFTWPSGLDYVFNGETRTATLDSGLLPELKIIQNHAREHQLPENAQAKKPWVFDPSIEVVQNVNSLISISNNLMETFGLEQASELEHFLAIFVSGAQNLDTETILSGFGSVEPTLSAHFAINLTRPVKGGHPPKVDIAEFDRWATTKTITIDSSTKERLLLLRQRICNKINTNGRVQVKDRLDMFALETAEDSPSGSPVILEHPKANPFIAPRIRFCHLDQKHIFPTRKDRRARGQSDFFNSTWWYERSDWDKCIKPEYLDAHQRWWTNAIDPNIIGYEWSTFGSYDNGVLIFARNQENKLELLVLPPYVSLDTLTARFSQRFGIRDKKDPKVLVQVIVTNDRELIDLVRSTTISSSQVLTQKLSWKRVEYRRRNNFIGEASLDVVPVFRYVPEYNEGE